MYKRIMNKVEEYVSKQSVACERIVDFAIDVCMGDWIVRAITVNDNHIVRKYYFEVCVSDNEDVINNLKFIQVRILT